MIGLCLPISVRAQPAPAPSDDKAKAFYESGKSFYQEGRYADALVAFEIAYRWSGRPTLLRSIGYCYEKLDRFEEALGAFYRWKSIAEPDKLGEIERHIRRIRDAMAARSLETELLETELLETEVDQFRRIQDASAAQSLETELNPTAPEPAPRPATRAERPAPAPRPEPPASAPWRLSTGPTVLYGISSAAVLTGTVFAIQADQARNEATTHCSTGDAVFCQDSALGPIGRDWTFSIIADSSFGLAGVSVVGATVWMILDNKPSNLRLSPSLQGLHLRGQF